MAKKEIQRTDQGDFLTNEATQLQPPLTAGSSLEQLVKRSRLFTLDIAQFIKDARDLWGFDGGEQWLVTAMQDAVEASHKVTAALLEAKSYDLD